MPLISKPIKIEKDILKVRVPVSLKQEIEQYCEWAQIDDLGHFFTEATELVFRQDKEWAKIREEKTETA